MRVRTPATYEVAVSEMNGVAALLDKNGWKAGLLIASSCKPGTAGRPRNRSDLTDFQRASFTKFAKDVNAKGWSRNIIERHFTAWEAAADAGHVPHAGDIEPGEQIEIPEISWQDFYPPTSEWFGGGADKEAIVAQATEDGTSATKALEIRNNPKALASAIKASPSVRAAAAAALAGTVEATEIAAEVMADPDQAEIVLGDEVVHESVVVAQARNLVNKRRAHTPIERPERPRDVGVTVGEPLTLMIVMDNCRRDLGHLGQMIEAGLPDGEMASIVRDFLTDEVLVIANGLLDHPSLTGLTLDPEMFKD